MGGVLVVFGGGEVGGAVSEIGVDVRGGVGLSRGMVSSGGRTEFEGWEVADRVRVDVGLVLKRLGGWWVGLDWRSRRRGGRRRGGVEVLLLLLLRGSRRSFVGFAVGGYRKSE